MEEHFLRSQYRVSLFMKILRSPGTQDFSISILCYNPPSMWRGRQILIKPSSCSSQSNANTSIHGSSGLQFGTLNATPVQNLSHLTLLWFPQCVLACVSHHHWSASCHGHRCNEICLKLSRREGHYWGTSPSNRHVYCLSEDGFEFESDFEFLPFCHANRHLCWKLPCFEIQELVVAKIGGESGA